MKSLARHERPKSSLYKLPGFCPHPRRDFSPVAERPGQALPPSLSQSHSSVNFSLSLGKGFVALICRPVAKAAAMGVKLVDFERLTLGVNEPVMRNAMASIDLHLERAILFLSEFREDFYDQVRRALIMCWRFLEMLTHMAVQNI